MKKLIVLFWRIIRRIQDVPIVFEFETENVCGMLRFFETTKRRLFCHQRRQLCIQLRKRGYRGPCTVPQMSKFLDERFLRPTFETEWSDTKHDLNFVCRVVPAPVHENLGLVA
jgi:hypothetical protein